MNENHFIANDQLINSNNEDIFYIEQTNVDSSEILINQDTFNPAEDVPNKNSEEEEETLRLRGGASTKPPRRPRKKIGSPSNPI